MLQCKWTGTIKKLYAAGRNPADFPVSMREHMEQCERCRVFVEELSRIPHVVRSAAPEPFPRTEEDQFLRELRMKIHKQKSGWWRTGFHWSMKPVVLTGMAAAILLVIAWSSRTWWTGSELQDDSIDSFSNFYLEEFEEVNSEFVLTSAVIFDEPGRD